jgi:hypothetical protein
MIMKTFERNILAVLLISTLATPTRAQAPQSIATPSKVETRLGTFEYRDGAPTKATADKVYDNLDFMHGVDSRHPSFWCHIGRNERIGRWAV